MGVRFVALALTAVGLSASYGQEIRQTYCNPLPLPGYPRGVFAEDDAVSRRLKCPDLLSQHGAFREAGDPAVLVENGIWYLYVSGATDACWKSADGGASWEKTGFGMPEFALGYAPAVVKFRNKFLLCSGWGSIDGAGTVYCGETPTGPFRKIGRLTPPRNDGAPECGDPMLFADDDGRLYFYWGTTPTKGIWGCELDPENPTRAISPAKQLVAYEPEKHPWEKFPDKPWGYVEGPFLFKRKGGYYLMFGAGGTEYPTYATGVARAHSPLGPFVLQTNNPVLFSPKGVVTGTAHGSVIWDGLGDWWYFYTVHASIRHQFERRIGMDRLAFDARGDIVAGSATSEPQAVSGRPPVRWPAIDGVSHCAGAAFDRSLETEFVPQALPYEVEYAFRAPKTVRAMRAIWSDGGYAPAAGVSAGPVRYRLSLKPEKGAWTMAADFSGNEVDLLVDYREIVPQRAVAARLTVLNGPTGVTPRLVEWTLFGE